MKHAISFLILLLPVQAIFAQIANGSFENWSTLDIYDTPAEWSSSNQQPFYDANTVFQSSDASHGNFSAQLGVALNYGDTIAGFVAHGDLNTNTGIPYTDNFEAVVVEYKIDLQPNDSLYLVLVRYNGGMPVDFQVKPFAFGAPIGTWTPQIIPVGNTVQNELLIGFVIGNPLTGYKPSPDSWAMVDNIKLLSGGIFMSDVPNNSFENWETKTVEVPDNWYTLNPLLTRHDIDNVVKSTDAFSGNFAIEMTTVDWNSDIMPGIVSMGEIDFMNVANPFSYVPFNDEPATVSGVYKYDPQGADVGELQVLFYGNGNIVGYHAEEFTAQSSYTPFVANISLASTPDSMLFLVASGDNIGSTLTLDLLEFDSNSIGVDEISIPEFSFSPNPATEEIQLVLADNQVVNARIISSTGETVWNAKDVENGQSIDVSKLPSGNYFVAITAGHHTGIQQLIVR
jgi:hypothetical protein